MNEPDSQQPSDNKYDTRPDILGLRATEAGSKGKDNSGVLAPDDQLNPDSSEGIEQRTTGVGAFKFNPSDLSPKARLLKLVIDNKRKGLVGGGVVATIVSILTLLFLMLIPLKIEHMVENLQSKFFATSESAISTTTENMFNNYIAKKVLPGIKSCGTTTSKDCKFAISGSNPVDNLYKTWHDNKLETKLATKYNIEFKYDRSSGHYYVKAPGTVGRGDNLGSNPDTKTISQEFNRTDRAGMRAAYRNGLSTETSYKKLFYRYKVGRLLEQKYGVKRCIVFCGTRDALADKKTEYKKAAQLFLAERVIQPRNESMYIAIACMLNPDCLPEKTAATTPTPGTDDTLHGAPENSQTDTATRLTLEQLGSQFGVEDTDKLLKIYGEMTDRGFQKYLYDKVFQLVFKETTSKELSDRIPYVGWVNMAAQLINTANTSSSKLKKLTYITNTAAAVSLYMTYRTYADEIHTGNVNAEEVGSWVTSLSAGDHGEATDPIVGGTASAEQAPLYASIMDTSANNTTTSSILSALLPATTYAAAASPTNLSGNYICNNGKPVPAGQLVCNEEIFGQGNKYANMVHDFLNLPGINIVTELAKIWGATIGQVFRWGSEGLSIVLSKPLQGLDYACDNIPGAQFVLVPGYCQSRDSIKAAVPYIMDGLTKWLLPNPFSSNMSGARKFNMMAGGADVAGHDSCEYQLGCRQITPSEYASIVNSQEQQAKQSFKKQSLASRLFDTNSPYSLASTVAMAIPLDTLGSAQNSFSSLLSNPIALVFNSFGSLFSVRASASSYPLKDPFGITQVGFPTNEIPPDPAAYWDANHCGDTSSTGPIALWQQQAASSNGSSDNIDPVNGMPIHSKVEPCLLIESAVGAAGGKFDTSLLSQSDVSGTSPLAATTTPTTTNQIIGNIGESSDSVPCAANTKDLGTVISQYAGSVKVGYAPLAIRLCQLSSITGFGNDTQGNQISGGAVVNSRVAGAWQALGEKAKASNLSLSSNSSFRLRDSCGGAGDGSLCAQPNQSMHQLGVAIDFATITVTGTSTTSCSGRGIQPGNAAWEWLNNNAASFGFKQYSFEAWHWDALTAANRCGGNGTM